MKTPAVEIELNPSKSLNERETRLWVQRWGRRNIGFVSNGPAQTPIQYLRRGIVKGGDGTAYRVDGLIRFRSEELKSKYIWEVFL